MTALTWDRHQGHAWSYDVVTTGYNYRIDEMRSALGRVQLAKLDTNNARRRALTVLYRDLLTELCRVLRLPLRDTRVSPRTTLCRCCCHAARIASASWSA